MSSSTCRPAGVSWLKIKGSHVDPANSLNQKFLQATAPSIQVLHRGILHVRTHSLILLQSANVELQPMNLVLPSVTHGHRSTAIIWGSNSRPKAISNKKRAQVEGSENTLGLLRCHHHPKIFPFLPQALLYRRKMISAFLISGGRQARWATPLQLTSGLNQLPKPFTYSSRTILFLGLWRVVDRWPLDSHIGAICAYTLTMEGVLGSSEASVRTFFVTKGAIVFVLNESSIRIFLEPHDWK